ncbi:FabD/lysophospholipase-like protein [Mycena sanguinolenta]|uniref:FabD/lysophospholipase-like protein n=1 Tax=Mycena sanguinolenta TaxID=230812 RepID=A0A8H7DDF9_9AGAR|nr:FabD/lysophospholipase-like protein [Mycena sanguinolenta]
MELSVKAEVPQQRSILTLSQQLKGTMLTEDRSRPVQLSITGGQGGPGGQGHSRGTGGAGGTGLGPTVNITAQQLNLSTVAWEPVSQQSKIRAAQIGIHCPPPSRIFQGRQDILNKMGNFFTSNTRTQKIYVLHGLGGAGKTQIALKFIKGFSSHFPDIFFIDTSTVATIDTGLKNIAIMKSSGDSLQEGLLWLTSQVEEWLLVFDNADDPRIDLQEFIPECDHGNIIITSRNPGLSVHAGSESLVSDMEEQDAVALLLQSAAQPITAATQQIAAKIVKALFYLPLAIMQAGAFISKSRNIGNYLDLYTKNQAQLLSEKPAQSQDRYKQTVYTTWRMSFDRLSTPAAMLLQHCSFLYYNGICEEIFCYASRYTCSSRGPSKEDLHQPLELLSHFLGPTGEWDSLQFTIVMNELQAYSLISFDEETKLFSVHPLVHAWGQTTVQNPGRYMMTVGTILGMTISKRAKWDSALPSLILCPHIELAIQSGIQPVWSFQYCYGQFFREAGKYKQAVTMLEAVLEEEGRVLGDEHMDTLSTMCEVAGAYSDLGEYQKAKDLEVIALEKWKQVFSDDHPDTLLIMGNLAATYSNLGEHQEAKDLEIAVLEKRKKILGDNHPDTLRAMANLATTYSDLGEYQQAKGLNIAVLEKREEILGDNHPDTLRAMGNLATTYSNLGEYQQAKGLNSTVLQKQKEILGDNHPDTLRAMTNLASTYSDLGDYYQAKSLEITVLEEQKQILGNNHPHTLLAMGNLATTYLDLGEYQEAKGLMITVLEKRKQILGDSHPYTLLAMGNLAATYSNLGEHQEAKDLEIAVLEKRKQILGNNHPDTLRAMANLASTYSDLGEYQQTKGLNITVLEKRKQILGDNHPATLLAMNNLATTYWDLEDYQKAKALAITVLEKQKQILGETHPHTLRAMRNLAIVYSALREHQKAQELRDLVEELEIASNKQLTLG